MAQKEATKEIKSLFKDQDFLIELSMILFIVVYFMVAIGSIFTNLGIFSVFLILTGLQTYFYKEFKKETLDLNILKIVATLSLLPSLAMFDFYGIFIGTVTTIISLLFIMVTYRRVNGILATRIKELGIDVPKQVEQKKTKKKIFNLFRKSK